MLCVFWYGTCGVHISFRTVCDVDRGCGTFVEIFVVFAKRLWCFGTLTRSFGTFCVVFVVT